MFVSKMVLKNKSTSLDVQGEEREEDSLMKQSTKQMDFAFLAGFTTLPNTKLVF